MFFGAGLGGAGLGRFSLRSMLLHRLAARAAAAFRVLGHIHHGWPICFRLMGCTPRRRSWMIMLCCFAVLRSGFRLSVNCSRNCEKKSRESRKNEFTHELGSFWGGMGGDAAAAAAFLCEYCSFGGGRLRLGDALQWTLCRLIRATTMGRRETGVTGAVTRLGIPAQVPVWRITRREGLEPGFSHVRCV